MTATTKTPRCTKAEKARRVTMVLRWLAQGCGHAEIVRHAAREWRVTQWQFQNFMAAASVTHAGPNFAASNLTPPSAPVSKQAPRKHPATQKQCPPHKP